jgi:hypothetical protein
LYLAAENGKGDDADADCEKTKENTDAHGRMAANPSGDVPGTGNGDGPKEPHPGLSACPWILGNG